MVLFLWVVIATNALAAVLNIALLAMDAEKQPVAKSIGTILSIAMIIWGVVLLVQQ